MAGLLLTAVLLQSFHQLKAQGVLPPTLTVHPAVITETDLVVLNCQTPSSVPVSECHFLIMGRWPAKKRPCLVRVNGTELLSWSHQSSPAEVKVSCLYLKGSRSPNSQTLSVIVRTTLPPTLTVNPSVINETDSVTLNCQTPSSVSASHCNILTLSGGSIKVPSCRQTLTGSKLLKLSHQSSPAQVKLSCFYSVKLEREDSPSPHSTTTSITINRQKPQKPEMSCEHSPGNYIRFTCSLPGPAQPGTKCNLYFGETNTPAMTVWSHTNPQQLFCGFTVQVDDFLRKLSSAQQKVASCDYTSGGPQSLSPRSDEYILTDIVKMETTKAPTVPDFTVTTEIVNMKTPKSPTLPAFPVTTGHDKDRPVFSTAAISTDQTSANPTVGLSTNILVSTFSTSVKPPPGFGVGVANTKDSTAPTVKSTSAAKWMHIALAPGLGVTVGILLMVSTVLCNRKRAGPEQQKRKEIPNPDNACYYSTISDEPAVTVVNDMYSTVGPH